MQRIRDAFHSMGRVKVQVQQQNIRTDELSKTILTATKANTLNI